MPQRSDAVVGRGLEDRTVLVNLETNRIFQLNATASRLWELVEDGCDRGEIERVLAEEFAVDPTQVASEVERMLAELAARGLTTDHGDD